MEFQFVSRYRDQTDYLPARANSGDRWRIRDDGRLTVGHFPATADQVDTFNAWRIAEHKRQLETMRADPVRYPPQFYDAAEMPRHLASVDAWRSLDRRAVGGTVQDGDREVTARDEYAGRSAILPRDRARQLLAEFDSAWPRADHIDAIRHLIANA